MYKILIKYTIATKDTTIEVILPIEEVEKGLFFGNLALPRKIIKREIVKEKYSGAKKVKK